MSSPNIKYYLLDVLFYIGVIFDLRLYQIVYFTNHFIEESVIQRINIMWVVTDVEFFLNRKEEIIFDN